MAAVPGIGVVVLVAPVVLAVAVEAGRGQVVDHRLSISPPAVMAIVGPAFRQPTEVEVEVEPVVIPLPLQVVPAGLLTSTVQEHLARLCLVAEVAEVATTALAGRVLGVRGWAAMVAPGALIVRLRLATASMALITKEPEVAVVDGELYLVLPMADLVAAVMAERGLLYLNGRSMTAASVLI